MARPRRRSAVVEAAAAAGLILLALVLRLNHLGWSLPHSYEEATPLRIAWQMWGWDQGIKVDLDPKFFNYPSLTFYIQFLVQGVLYAAMKLFGAIETLTDWRVMYVIDPTPIFLAARLVSVLFAVGTAWIVYRTGRLVGGVGVALLALGLVAVNPFHVARSQMVEVDVPLTFFVALALHQSVRIALQGRRRDYFLAGIAAGLAASCKYTGAIVILPIVAAHIVCVRTPRKLGRPESGRLRNLALAVALAIVSFLATSPFVLINTSEFQKDFRVEQEHMALGHFGQDERATWMYYAQALSTDVMSMPAVIAALVGIGLVIARRSRAALVLAGFVVLYLSVVSTWTMKAERYLLPVLPPMVVLSAVGLLGIGRRVHEWLPRVNHALIVAILSACLLGVDALGYARHVDSYQGDTRTEVADWFLSNARSGSYVVTELYGPNLVAPYYILTLDPAMKKAMIERIQGQPKFAVQTLPMFQVNPERSGRFYTFDLYPNADYFVVSSAVASRYKRDPKRFAAQNEFYRLLDQHFEKVGDFLPARPGNLRITVYRRPSAIPFAGRRPEPPPTLAPAGMNPIDARFYFQLGTNYEAFSMIPEASQSYRLGIEQGTEDRHLFQNCVLGEARCILAQRGGREAAVFVRSLAQRVEDTAMREELLRIAGVIEENLRRSGQNP